MVVAGLAAAVGVGGALRTASRRGRAWQERVTERWHTIADQLEATLQVEGVGSLRPRVLTLTRDHGDARVVARAAVPTDPVGLAHTRVVAGYALGRGPGFEMRERGPADGPALERSVLGGDSALVRRVRLDAPDATAAARVWTEEARRRAAAFPRPLAVRSDGEAVEMLWDGVELHGDVLDGALSLVGELALHGLSVLRTLRALEGASWEPARGPGAGPVVRVHRGPVAVSLGARVEDATPIYEARVEPRGPVPDFEAAITDGRIEGELPEGVLDADAAAELPRVGEATLRAAPGAVTLAFDDEPDPARAEAAVRLLAAVAQSSGRRGAFR